MKVENYIIDPSKIDAATIKDIEAAKSDSRSNLATVKAAQSQLKKLSTYESQFSHAAALDVAEELLETCPSFHILHVAKANALINLQRWNVAKEFLESNIESAPDTLLSLHCHTRAIHPVPSRDKLYWKETGVNNMVAIDQEAVINAILFMGSEKGALYVSCLKNLDISRTCCADVMDRVSSIISDISKRIGNAAVEYRWKWIQEEQKKIQSLVGRKNSGDKMFRLGRFHEALHHYSEAIEVC